MAIQNATFRVLHARKGFTLIEIMAVLGIIGVLTAVAITAINTLQHRASVSRAKTELQYIKLGIQQYQLDTKKYPTRLMDLINKPEGVSGWTKGYLSNKETLTDPWGYKYQYKLTPENPKKPFVVYSYGSSSGKATPKDELITAE